MTYPVFISYRRSRLEGALIDEIIGVMTEQPEPYKWRTRIRSIASVVLGATTAFFPVAVAWSFDRNFAQCDAGSVRRIGRVLEFRLASVL